MTPLSPTVHRGPAAVVLAAPYEATTSFVPGCVSGPEAIAEELAILRRCDAVPEYAQEDDLAWRRAHDRRLAAPERMVRAVSRSVRSVLDRGRLPIVAGGEHTVTVGALAAFDDPAAITVVQFDAHADLRAEYGGTPWSHACVMRRVFERGHPLVQVGVRSGCAEEIAEVYAGDAAEGLVARRGPPSALLLTRSGLRARGAGPALAAAGGRIYVTIDLDVLDPSCAPGVGTPDPDGLGFLELLGLLEALLRGRRLVGADVVELCPARDDGRTARLAARLVRFLAAGLSGPGGASRDRPARRRGGRSSAAGRARG
jgi:agmatinase